MVKQIDSKIPQIRFKGYMSSWVEEPVLSRIAKIIDFRGRTPKKLGLDWSESGYLALSALNVKDGYIDRSAEAHFGNKELYNAWMKGNELHCNQVLFTTEAPMGNVAQIPDTQKYILSQRTIAFVTDPLKLSEDYLAISLKSPSVFEQLLARSSGGTAKGVSQKSLSSLNIFLSDELDEQTQIGAYFKELDRMIGLHQRKHNKLVTLKQAMLQKMFPQDGATTPEIRFKGFFGDWNETTLGEQAVITMGQSPLGCTYTDNPSDFILVQGNADMKNGYVVPRVWTTQVTKIANAGDLILSVRAPVGEAGKTTYDIVLGRGVAGLKGNEFIFQSLLRMKMFGFWDRFSSGSTFDSVNSDDVKFASLIAPCKAEQQKIGTYFRKLDALIAQHTTQLEKLKQIKSACLEKMFV